jgi:hypothetical protein
MADTVQLLREAVATVLRSDGPQGTAGTLQNLCGRTTDLVRDESGPAEPTMPMVTYAVDRYQGFGREGAISVGAAADGPGAAALVNAILARAEAILTAPALKTAGIDAAPVGQPVREPLEQDPESDEQPALVLGSTQIPLLVFA